MVKKHISACVDSHFFDKVKDYCRRHQMSVASLISESVANKIDNEWQAEILAKCERLIEAKIAQPVIDVDVEVKE